MGSEIFLQPDSCISTMDGRPYPGKKFLLKKIRIWVYGVVVNDIVTFLEENN